MRPALSRVGLVGCGASKLTHRAKARDLYTGSLFRKSLAYAEATCEATFIVSAAHGLVYLDQELGPYDTTIASLSAWGRARWAENVLVWVDVATIARGLGVVELVILAGASYADLLVDEVRRCRRPWLVAEPLRGLQIGQRLRWLNRALEAAPARAGGGSASG